MQMAGRVVIIDLTIWISDFSAPIILGFHRSKGSALVRGAIFWRCRMRETI